MGFLQRVLGLREDQDPGLKAFWDWFVANEKQFYQIIKDGADPEDGFFDLLGPRLEELKDGFYFLSGMYDDNRAELILSAEGNIANIVFVEELVRAAPHLKNWKFTALKQALRLEDVSINMDGYDFNSDNLSFYPIADQQYPDNVDIVIVYDGYSKDDETIITNGVYLFLDNSLGELTSITAIDELTVMGKEDTKEALIAIAKLKDYLIWREKEFVEKYNGSRHNTENDMHSTFEAKFKDGRPLFAVMNMTLLDWDSKASHPWILSVKITYKGNEDGMPDKETYELLDAFEGEVVGELTDFDGYLNIGRETADNCREIYFACKEFRKPSKVLFALSKEYECKLAVTYEIYKDKYWRYFERFSGKG